MAASKFGLWVASYDAQLGGRLRDTLGLFNGFAMKRKSDVQLFNRLKYRCPPVALYLEDITQIVEVLDNRGAQYSISDTEYDYESLEKIRSNRGEKVKGLAITARFEGAYDSLTLEFERGAIFLRSNKSEKLIVLWHEIRDILSRRAPWYLRLVCWPPMPYLAFAVVFFLPKQPELLVAFPTKAYWLQWVIPVIFLLALLSASATLWQPVLHLKKEHELESFFGRNAERLIVGFIGSIFGAVAKVIFDKLFT